MFEADYLIYEGGIDWGTVQVSHNTFKYPTQIGEDITSTTVGTRDTSINGWIIGKDLKEIESKKNLLTKHINPLQPVEIIVGTHSLHGVPATNVKFSNTKEENNEVMCKFLMQFLCSNPMFVLSEAVQTSIASTRGGFGFPLIFKPRGIIMGLRTESLFTDILNEGAIEVGMVITIEATGTVNNPTIVEVNTNQKMRMNMKLEAGDKVIIDTNRGERSVVGYHNGKKANYLGYFDYDNDWLQAKVGITTLTIKSYGSDGLEDDTYKKLDVSVAYKPALYNLGGE